MIFAASRSVPYMSYIAHVVTGVFWSVIWRLDPDIIGKKLKIGRDDDGDVMNYLLKLLHYPTSASAAILQNGGRPILTLI